MDNMACNKGQHVRKAKKKPVKDELDRLKQAEKKKRRLEKALATSAAIISELEKKKQKKKEEQQRLDEEGAAIAEAVALHVLLGEDSDDSSKAMNDGGCKPWNCSSDLDLFLGGKRACFPHLDGGTWSVERMGWVSDAFSYGCKLGGAENGKWSFSFGPVEKNVIEPLYEEAGWGPDGFSADLIAAQAVSSLQIAEDADEEERLVPKIVIVVKRSCDRTEAPFSQLLIHRLQCYSTLLESLDAVNVNLDVLQIIEKYYVHSALEKMVSSQCHGGRMVVAPWKTLFLSCRFSPAMFSGFTEAQAECLVQRSHARRLHVEKRQGSLLAMTESSSVLSPPSLSLELTHSATFQLQNVHLTASHMRIHHQDPKPRSFLLQVLPIPCLSEFGIPRAMPSKTRFPGRKAYCEGSPRLLKFIEHQDAIFHVSTLCIEANKRSTNKHIKLTQNLYCTCMKTSSNPKCCYIGSCRNSTRKCRFIRHDLEKLHSINKPPSLQVPTNQSCAGHHIGMFAKSKDVEFDPRRL
ncbi:uncharacterized protein G2W53_034097 [Senna tora]|uniref:Uncharacterized protein n=1 Tax=Senna tora TaxID=362788 RepID=A0A834T2L0_9FABA|nr:uncharacterized protein G2W53_034097 [Senna tora]